MSGLAAIPALHMHECVESNSQFVLMVDVASICLVGCRVPHKTNLTGARLEQLASIPLAGLVESIAVLRGRSSLQKDALLLTFRSATHVPAVPILLSGLQPMYPLSHCTNWKHVTTGC